MDDFSIIGFQDVIDSHNILNGFITPEVSAALFDGCEFSAEEWNQMDDDQKVGELNELESNIAHLQGRDSIEIQTEDMDSFWDMFTGKKRYGYFDPNTNEIFVNSSLLDSADNLVDLVDTVIHEGYHGYQHACINGTATHPDPMVVAEWKDNFENYLDPNIYGYEAYYNQPVEVSAREMAAGITDSFYTQYA